MTTKTPTNKLKSSPNADLIPKKNLKSRKNSKKPQQTTHNPPPIIRKLRPSNSVKKIQKNTKKREKS